MKTSFNFHSKTHLPEFTSTFMSNNLKTAQSNFQEIKKLICILRGAGQEMRRAAGDEPVY